MKELSIQEKATRYDEALKEAVIAHKDEDRHLKATLERIFPELKESDDDSMVKFIKNQLFNIKKTITENYELDEKLTKAICWLEKQCEQKIKTPEESLGIDSDTYNKIVDECIYGEQKPIDKVEQKFKVEKDKWYVCTSQYYNCFEGRNYKASLDGRIIDDYGTEYDMHSDAYRWFRPWTIQDAKDGDILCSNQIIVLFKQWEDDIDYNFVIAHAGIDISGKLQITNGHWLINNKSKPATKEQRDLLFQKMHESGYEWDAENKELIKIEHKPAWNEKDNEHVNSLLKRLDGLCRKEFTTTRFSINDDENWLKSIKDKYTWKPSEEQIEALKQAKTDAFGKPYFNELASLYINLKGY